MTNLLKPFAFTLVSVFALGACCNLGKTNKEEEAVPGKDPKPTPATASAPATSTAPSAASKTRKLTSEEVASRVKQIMQGHSVHPEHCFAVNLSRFEGSMLATTGPNGKAFVFHIFDASGKRTISLFDKDKEAWEAKDILAVAFEDVDRDGAEDLIALGSYKSGKNGASVYTRPGGGQFAFNAALTQKAGGPASIAAVLAALR